MSFHPEPASLFGSGAWVNKIDLRQPRDGERMDLGREFDMLALKYGEPGVLRGYDWRGVAFQEVRRLDFGAIPLNGACPSWMDRRDFVLLMKLTHTPEHVMIHASGGQYSKPVTGKWIRASEHRREFDRLSRMKILGRVHE